jgi:hypothetical protein
VQSANGEDGLVSTLRGMGKENQREGSATSNGRSHLLLIVRWYGVILQLALTAVVLWWGREIPGRAQASVGPPANFTAYAPHHRHLRDAWEQGAEGRYKYNGCR